MVRRCEARSSCADGVSNQTRPVACEPPAGWLPVATTEDDIEDDRAEREAPRNSHRCRDTAGLTRTTGAAAVRTIGGRDGAASRGVLAPDESCERLGDPVELGFGQARVERQREGSLEGAISARERALVTVWLQTVHRERADLRLDLL